MGLRELCLVCSMLVTGCCEIGGAFLQAYGEAAFEAVMEDLFDAVYDDGAISLGAGVAFPSEESLRPGACADFQVRAYFFKYVTWDIGYRGFRFRNKANLDALSADMFVVALGASSKVMVAGGEDSPFRWGVAAVAAFPSYYYDDHVVSGGRALGGVKFKLDWIPMPDKDDWNSAYLQADLLFGPSVLDASGPVEWDLYPVVMLCAGFQASW